MGSERMISPLQKKSLFLILVALYFLQSFLVYSDGPSGPPMDALSQRGARAFQRHNCQACHQIFGYGGFWGPDLTNLADRVAEDELEPVLKRAFGGRGRMPEFDFSEQERSSFAAFFRTLNKSGRGQAIAPEALGFSERVEAALLRVEEKKTLLSGWQFVESRGCLGCHPGEGSGAFAPAFSGLGLLSESRIDEALLNGRPPRMPAISPALSDDERRELKGLLRWLANDFSAVASANSSVLDFSQIPWWEF
jgi:nitric oxide reductase subunit C